MKCKHCLNDIKFNYSEFFCVDCTVLRVRHDLKGKGSLLIYTKEKEK
jgi:hypothetical protein